MKIGDFDPSLVLRPHLGSGVSDRAHGLEQRDLQDLTPGEIAFCLRQSIALPSVIPIALQWLMHQPWLEAELYPGDLLWAVLHVATRNSSLGASQVLLGICESAIADPASDSEEPLAAARNFLAAYHRT